MGYPPRRSTWEPRLLEKPRITSGSPFPVGTVCCRLKLQPQKIYKECALSTLKLVKVLEKDLSPTDLGNLGTQRPANKVQTAHLQVAQGRREGHKTGQL